MAHIHNPEVEFFRLGTGQTAENYDPHFWDACNQLPKKTYITYPYSLKQERAKNARKDPAN